MESRKKPVDEAARLAAIHAKLPVVDKSALDAQVAAKQAAADVSAQQERCVASRCWRLRA